MVRTRNKKRLVGLAEAAAAAGPARRAASAAAREQEHSGSSSDEEELDEEDKALLPGDGEENTRTYQKDGGQKEDTRKRQHSGSSGDEEGSDDEGKKESSKSPSARDAVGGKDDEESPRKQAPVHLIQESPAGGARTVQEQKGAGTSAAKGVAKEGTDNFTLSDVKKIIGSASKNVQLGGYEEAERRVRLLQMEELESNPVTKDILAFMHMVMSNQSFMEQGRSYMEYINKLARSSCGEESEKLARSINVALGRPADGQLTADPGDLFIKEAYERGYGWSWQQGSNHWKCTPESLCGFDMQFIMSTVKRSNYDISQVPEKGGDQSASNLRNERYDLITGTLVVVVQALVRDALSDDAELLEFFSQHCPTKTVALLIGGMYHHDLMSKNKAVTKEVKEKLKKPRVENLEEFGELKDRVAQMIKARKDRGSVTKGDLTADDAIAWLDRGKKDRPAKKRQKTGKANEDDSEAEDDEDEEDIVSTAEESGRAPPDLEKDEHHFHYQNARVQDEDYSNGPTDDGAEIYFKRLFETCFVDGVPIPPDTPPEARPSVEREILKGFPMSKNINPELLILRNALSEAFVQALVSMYESYGLPFVREESKGFRAFVLDDAESQLAKASFQMGKDAAARFMKAWKAHLYERIFTILMESRVRAALKHKFGEEFELVFNCGGVNVCLLYYRKGFAFHFDHDAFNTRLDRKRGEPMEDNSESVNEQKDSKGEDDGNLGAEEIAPEEIHEDEYVRSHGEDKQKAPMPTPKTMVIVTLVLCGPLGSVKPGKQNYSIKWRTTVGGNVQFSKTTGHNEIHIQIGLDEHCEHGGFALKYEFLDNCWRLTITLRCYINPTVNLKAWQARAVMFNLTPETVLLGERKEDLIYDILNKFQNPQLTAVSAEVGSSGRKELATEQSSGKSKKKETVRLEKELLLSHESNRDVYTNCPFGDTPNESMLNLSKVPAILQQRQPIVKLYLSWIMQSILLKYRLILRILIYNHGNREMLKRGMPIVAMAVPMFETGSGGLVLPDAMTYYSVAAMQLLVNVKHTNRAKPIICNEHRFACTSVVLTCVNRVDHESLRKVLLKSADEFFFYGSGGAGHVVGQAGSAAKKAYTSETDAWGYPPSPQDTDTNKINEVLLRCAENTQMLSVWLGPEIVRKVMGDDMPPMKNDEYLHVGRFYCYGEETREGKTSYATAMDKDEYGLDENAGFRLRSHKVYHVRRIAEDRFKGLHNKKVVDPNDPENDWRVIAITDRSDEYADLRLPEEEYNLIRQTGVGADVLAGAVARQLEYHFEQRILPIREQLLRVNKVPVIGEWEPDKREDSKPWIEDRNKLREDNPFAVPLDKEKKRRLKKISLLEFRLLMQAIAMGGFMRMLNMSIKKGSQFSIPLSDVRLGSIIRQFSFPMPIRDYDVCPLLYMMLSKSGVRYFNRNDERVIQEKSDKSNLGEDLLAALICHLYGRPGFIGNYIEHFKEGRPEDCLRRENVPIFIAHMKRAVSDHRVSMSRCVVQQYEKQIPAPLRTSVNAAAYFLASFAEKLDNIVEMLLPGKMMNRRQYVMALADVMASLIPGVAAPKFYFLAQHIVATLALSYWNEAFGKIGLEDVHMGPGSKEAVEHLGLLRERPARKEADGFDCLANYLHEHEMKAIFAQFLGLRQCELNALGMFSKNGKLFVMLTGRLLTYLDIEHMLCKLYLFLNKKSPPGLQSLEPWYHLCQCHPARFNMNVLDIMRHKLDLNGETMENVAKIAVNAFDEDMKDFKLTWKLLFRDEWSEKTPDFDQPPLLDPELERYETEVLQEEESRFIEAAEGADEDGRGCFVTGPNVYWDENRLNN